jgi:Xaa-Pro aminopeptidase
VAADEFGARRVRVSSEFNTRKIDALIVPFGANLRYLTGFTGSNGLLLAMPDGDAVLFTDPRYRLQAARQVNCDIQVCTGHLLPALIEVIKQVRLRRIGFDPDRMTCAQRDAISSGLPMRAALIPITGWIETLRAVKSASEIALIRRSVETNSSAFAQAVKHARAGMRESDLAAELDYRMRKHGAEKPAFDTIVATGERSALPHAQPSAARLRNGDMVVVDMGAFQDGYASDMTRMLHLGEPGAKARHLYRSVLEAQRAALDGVRPGISAMHVDRLARRVLKTEKLDNAFIHSTGHGLGLEIHEPPRLGKKEKMRLQEGMAITIEPGAYLEGFGGVRIEDTVVVTRTGCEILTPTSKELYVL